jgi:hypothetical protein
MVDQRDAVLNVVPVAAIRVRNAVAVPRVDHAAGAAAWAVVVAWIGNVRVGFGMRGVASARQAATAAMTTAGVALMVIDFRDNLLVRQQGRAWGRRRAGKPPVPRKWSRSMVFCGT